MTTARITIDGRCPLLVRISRSSTDGSIHWSDEIQQWVVPSGDFLSCLREAARTIDASFPRLEHRIAASVQVMGSYIPISGATTAEDREELSEIPPSGHRLIAKRWSMQVELQWDEAIVSIDEVAAVLLQSGSVGLGSGRSVGYGCFFMSGMRFGV
jgi:hypothetical protein